MEKENSFSCAASVKVNVKKLKLQLFNGRKHNSYQFHQKDVWHVAAICIWTNMQVALISVPGYIQGSK